MVAVSKEVRWAEQDHVLQIPVTVTIRSPRSAGRIELVRRLVIELAQQGIPFTPQDLAKWLQVTEQKAQKLLAAACLRIASQHKAAQARPGEGGDG